jgi:hypothetical protein
MILLLIRLFLEFDITTVLLVLCVGASVAGSRGE